MKKKAGILALAAALALMMSLAACGRDVQEAADTASKVLTEADLTLNETIEATGDGEHAIEVDASEKEVANTKVVKTGEAEGDEADFYGDNSAIFATNGATLDLKDISVNTNGTHANAVFTYGEGTTVNIAHSVIETSGNCSGGLMTTGGGTTNASDLTISTKGNSSAAIRSDRGGGTMNITGGNYTTQGVGSPVIYSTADVTVTDANLTSMASQGVVIEGKNSVTLKDSVLSASNTEKNGDKSDHYQAVMIYQSMSGDAAEGKGEFTMDGGKLINKNGDVFFVNNTIASISLTGVDIQNDGDGIFLRAAAAGWGNEGSNGGQLDLNAANQKITGDIVVDDVSVLNYFLKDKSSYEGAINTDGQAGDVYVEIEEGSTWKLTADSYVTSLTCDADSIDLNGHKLYVNGKEYKEGAASKGSAIEFTQTSGGQGGPGEAPPDGEGGQGGPGGGTPPAKPE
jgi:hypothetical protein